MASFKQITLGSTTEMKLELNLEDYIPSDDLSRQIITVVDSLDIKEIESTYSEIGQRAYPPRIMLRILFYGYTQGIRSGEKLKQACRRDIVFIYLAGGLRPSKSTINDFKANHHSHFAALFQQLVKYLISEGYTNSKEVYGDGTTIRANASANRSKTKSKFEKWLSHLQDDIAEIEKANGLTSTDSEQTNLDSKLQSKKQLAQKIKHRLNQWPEDAKPTQKLNLTDEDAYFMKGKKGGKDTFYNTQVVVSDEQFILHNHISCTSSDKKELIPCIEGIKNNIGQYPEKAAFDSGYSSFSNEEYAAALKGFTLYMPEQNHGKSYKNKPFHITHFQFDPVNDFYLCPQRKRLVFHRHKNYGGYQNRIYKGLACQQCPVRALCTKAKARTIHREIRQPLRNEMNTRLLTTKGKLFYDKRRHKVEPVFGHFKYNQGYQYFLLRGKAKVTAEFNLMCIAYNLIRMWNLIKIKLRQPLIWLANSLLKSIARFMKKLNLIVNELLKIIVLSYISIFLSTKQKS